MKKATLERCQAHCDQRRIGRFLDAPHDFARRNPRLPLPLFQAVADTVAVRMTSSRQDAESELAALLADIGAIDRDALIDVLLGDENVLRERMEAVLAALPSEAATHTAELRAVLADEPVRVPEVEELRATLYAAACADVPRSLPAELVERIEDVQESAAVVLSELDEIRPVSPGERFRQALVALRCCAEASGAPPPVVRLGATA